MTRAQTLLVTTAMALALPLASAIAQTASTTTKCGPVAWSTERMAYSSAPCAGGQTTGVVGTSGPTAFGANNSTSMTKAEMKQDQTATYYPAQAQAAASGPSMAPMNDQCGPSNAATITDEYGRKYNCRGDRIRR